ncbi:MAG: phosphatidylglycerol lysyltransferase domain-containing protein [Muribaculaceae bacterium]|nr:phosphatidylglycerol lysyltransferase domain-containing protein [Muribaculaceae bacterium]
MGTLRKTDVRGYHQLWAPPAPSVKMHFGRVTAADVPRFSPMLHSAATRSCDFTAGGIFMWADYFRYEAAVQDGTLFISGLSQDASRIPSFLLPVGDMPLEQAVELLRAHCRASGRPLLISAVPEDRLPELLPLGVVRVDELGDWADYVYRADDLSALAGKAYSKKRNHVHRFEADNPGAVLETLTMANAAEAAAFLQNHDMQSEKANPVMAAYERDRCLDVLRDYTAYPFEGVVLRGGDGRIVAFSIGELSGDTLIVHVEKMDHAVSGAGEAINCYFARYMLDRHPELVYINREDDSGDPGLRFAKESYHPAFLLRKYNVVLTI